MLGCQAQASNTLTTIARSLSTRTSASLYVLRGKAARRSLVTSSSLTHTKTRPFLSCIGENGTTRHRTRYLQLQSSPFSTTSALMTATKIDGTAIAQSIREKLNAQIKKTQEQNPRYKPSLVIIQGQSRAHACLTRLLTGSSWRSLRLEYACSHPARCVR